ncbi:MAG TPA: serine/threonine-protein kinase, partial [Pseudomonadota bacterium]|nr:serine/threonine-protein kinase [Pseudomonadota bacterium]
MLSKGGMGMVYKATHTVLDKPLAFKVMLQPQDEAARQRFLLEAKLAVQVRHRNIVDVVDFGVLSTNQPFLVMEFLVGQTLQELIEQGPIPPARMCFLAAQVACGLAEVHRKGIVHRDLKPANILFRRDMAWEFPRFV